MAIKYAAVRVVYSNASSTGYGSYTVEHGILVASGHWSSAHSSKWNELLAVRMVLELFKVKLANERIHWFTDNHNVVRIVQYGNLKPLLQAEAVGIFSICANNHICIEPDWIPREQNELVDYCCSQVASAWQILF